MVLCLSGQVNLSKILMNEVLVKKYTWACGLIMILITASLYFNILALSTPFLTIYHFIEPDEIYSLFGAVKLMWGYNLYIIAILIVGFSIIFPFVKLIVLFYICFVIRDAKARFKTITIIEALAKWSMLDVFVVCILLVLTNNQVFVSSKPNIGIYYFLLAIFISIICSIWVDHLCEKTYPVFSDKINARHKFISEKFTEYEKVLMIILLLISIAFFIFAITDNYIQVSEFFLTKNSYSIIQTCFSLKHLSPILAWFVGFVLIIFPSVIFNYMFIFWATSYHPTFHLKIMKLINKLSKFMMLDVFCLALILFLMEGSIIIGAKSRAGLYMLELYVFMSFLLPMFINYYAKIRYFFFARRIR
jgi:paraquat-inducible protein A